MAINIDPAREQFWTAQNINRLKLFEQEFLATSEPTVAQKVKTFEDDPTAFGEVLQLQIRISRIEEMAGKDALADRVRDMADKLRHEVTTRMPRCSKCPHFNLELVTGEDTLRDETRHTLRTQCRAPAVSSNTLVCPDGELAVKKGFKALTPDWLNVTEPLLVANHAPEKPNIRTSPDTPMTASDDAW